LAQHLIAVAVLLLAACSGGGPASDPNRGAETSGSATGTPTTPQASPASAATVPQCKAGERSACFCPDGTQTGMQTCSTAGALGACTGCKTQSVSDASGATVASAGPAHDGALCPKLRGEVSCTDQSFQSQKLPPSILFLLDRSGSMMCNAPESGQSSADCDMKAQTLFFDKPTKWAITTAALEKMFGKLADSGASAGLQFFSTDDVCGVSSMPVVKLAKVDQTQVSAMTAALAATNPSGGTPIVGGTILAYDHLYEEAGLDASGGCAEPPCGASGNRFVVLITDGSDSCPMEPTPGACGGEACTDFLLDHGAPDARGVNIRTFVIGVPGSEPARGFLSELALRGGTAKNGGQCSADRHAQSGDCHFDMSTSQDLASDLSRALDAISGAALSCEFPVPQVAGRAPSRNVNVQYRPGGTGDPVCLALDEKPCEGGANGWQFSKTATGEDDLSRVVLCGGACDTIKSDPKVRVDVVLGCQALTQVQ
jgi:hypothetical protein